MGALTIPPVSPTEEFLARAVDQNGDLSNGIPDDLSDPGNDPF